MKNIKKVTAKKIVIAIIVAILPFAFITCSMVTLVAGVTMKFFGSDSVGTNLSASDNNKLLAYLKNKTEQMNQSNTFDEKHKQLNKLCDYYFTDIRFKQGWQYTLAFIKYWQISKDTASAETVDSVENDIDSVIDIIKPEFIYKKDKVVTVRQYVVINKIFNITSGTPDSTVVILSSKPSNFSASQYADNVQVYIVSENLTYKCVKSGNTVNFQQYSGRPASIQSLIIIDTKPPDFDRGKYKKGDKIYIVSENKTYEAAESKQTKTDKKEQDEYFVTSIKNIEATYAITYKSQSITTGTPDDKTTITKPVIDSMKQIDKPYDNLRAIIKTNYPDEDVKKATDGIVTIANSLVNGDPDDPNYSTGDGTFNGSGEVFNGDQQAFIQKIAPGAQAAYQKHHVLPSITISQAIVESAWGKSGLTQKANNLFGIKAFSDWTGPYVVMMTREYNADGSSYFIPAKFKAYNSWADSVEDHAVLLSNPRYKKVISASNYTEAAYALSEAGYATDPNYPLLLIGCIQKYNLDQYDTMPASSN